MSYFPFAPSPSGMAMTAIPRQAFTPSGGPPAAVRTMASNNTAQQSNNQFDDDEQMVDAIERILSAEENRRIVASSPSACMQGSSQSVPKATVGPLSDQELTILSLLCTKAASTTTTTVATNCSGNSSRPPTHGFGSVDGDLLTTLAELLEKHVNMAVGVDLVQEALPVILKRDVKMDQWLRNGASGGQRVAALRLGLEAASILLFIVTSPGVEPRVVNEDAIDASFTLLRHHLSKNVIPALNNTGHLQAAQAEEDEKGITTPRKRKRKSVGGGESNPVVRELRKVYKHIASMIPLQLQLMERIEVAVQKLFLDDQQIVTLASGALQALEIEAAMSPQNPANKLQLATISLVTAVFRKFPMHRSGIIEDIFPLMLRLPTSKKNMRACPVRYSSSPKPEGANSLNTYLFSNMLTNGPEPHYIQIVTALLLSLIQCCVVRPTFANKQDQQNDQGAEDAEEPNGNCNSHQLESGLRGCQEVSDMFAVQLLQRCSRKGEDGGASEFRPILNNLIEDLLLVLIVPEYPAAQMVLQSCTHGLSRDIIIASQATNSSSSDTVVESTYVNTSFDTLGRICAAYAKIVAAQRDKEVHTTVHIPSGNENKLRCYCERNEEVNALMIDCDKCHAWYHAQCVGLTRDTLPSFWQCDACSYQSILEEEKNAPDHSNASRSIIDTTFMMNRFVEATLRSKRQFRIASKYHTAKWVQELTKQSKAKQTGGLSATGYEQAINHILERWDSRSAEPNRLLGKVSFSEEGGARALLLLTITSSNFMKSFECLMGLMLKLMSDKAHASLRKLSIKAIEKVVDADPKLMLLPKVMDAVSQRLSDESISVREAVVSLVGSYVVSSPVLANAFHSHLMPRLLDPGVSVRKRTVKILQDILCSNPHYKGRSDACDKCLRRAADPKEDDGVREALHSLFMKLWLEDGDIYVASNMDTTASPTNRAGLAMSPALSTPGSVDGQSPASGVVTPTPPIDGRATRSKQKRFGKVRSELAAEQMVAAVKIAGTNENLGNFMRELLCNVNDSDKGKKAAERIRRQKVAEKQCFNLVDSLFELLLATEEKRGRQVGTGADLVALVRTIGVFAEVSTGAVLRHLETVLPYLKADNGLPAADESAIASAASDIVFRVSPMLDKTELERMSQGTVGEDLVKITYKHGSGALFSAVRALCALAHHPDAGEENAFGKKLMGLARTFYAYLLKKWESDDFSDARVNVKRALSSLGSLCRHHEVSVEVSTWNDEVDVDDFELFETAELTWSNIPVACFRLFSKYLNKSDPDIKSASLRALSGIFVQHPRLMLASAQSGLIEEVMSSDSPLELQMESLRCWRDISLAEEKRIDSGEAKKKIDSKAGITTSKKISGDQDGDSTLVGGVLTKQTPRLFEMTQSKEAGLRIASLELLGQLLRQGLVNPNEAVPFLLALQGDVENVVVRKFALNLLILEGEKRPDMLRQRVCAGMKQACRLQREVYPSNETSALVKKHKGHRIEVECVFDDVFRECIVSSRKQREGLYRNLIAMFERVESPSNNGKVTSSAKKAHRRKSGVESSMNGEFDTPLLSFCCQVLAYLPYTSAGDPLFIQHHITSIVALQGPQLQDRLAAFLRPYGLASSDELDETNAEEDDLERAAKTSAPSRSKEAAPLNGKDFDWPGFVVLVQEASALALLLRLKNFLRKRYNLTEARCLEYNPDSKERSFGRNVVSRNDNIELFDSSVVNVSPGNLIHGDEDRLIHHYASFRRLMREEVKTDDNEIDVDSDTDGNSKLRPSISNGIIEPGADDVEEEEQVNGESTEAVESTKKAKKRRRSSAASKSRKRRNSSG